VTIVDIGSIIMYLPTHCLHIGTKMKILPFPYCMHNNASDLWCMLS